MIPGLPSLPPLQLSANATSRAGLDFGNASFSASGPGDWNVNFAPGGSAASGGIPLLWLLFAGGAAWMLLKK